MGFDEVEGGTDETSEGAGGDGKHHCLSGMDFPIFRFRPALVFHNLEEAETSGINGELVADEGHQTFL